MKMKGQRKVRTLHAIEKEDLRDVDGLPVGVRAAIWSAVRTFRGGS